MAKSSHARFLLRMHGIGVCLFFLGLLTVRADERILWYHSDVTIEQSGDLIVAETITVRSEGDRIRRGIFRDFPTKYEADNIRYNVGMEVLEVLRDGVPEPYHVEAMSNGKRIYIGSQDVFLEPAEYAFTIKYRTTYQLGFFETHDELYWNVTGNGWEFEIDGVSAEVHLPPSISGQVMETSGYTGPFGSRDRNVRVSTIDPSTVYFETTLPLNYYEGLTIVLTWPKGLIAEPSRMQKTMSMARSNPGIAVGALGLVLVFSYFLYFWFKVGRDPKKGVVIPQFKPPVELSPAEVRYVMRMGYDNKAFAAALIQMAVKGFLKIEEKKKEYTLIKLKSDMSGLSSEEKKIANKLFMNHDKIAMKSTHATTFQSVVHQLQTTLRAKCHKVYFFSNTSYFIPGLILSIVVMVVSATLFSEAVPIFILVWLGVWSIGVVFLIKLVLTAWKGVFIGKSGAKGVGPAIFITLFALPFFGGEVAGIVALAMVAKASIAVILVGLIVINAVYARLLRAPTPAGRRLMDRLEGFKMYLSAVETPRWKVLQPPEKTPELFEAYLPYALALDVEQEWAKQFSDVLSSAGKAAASGGGYTPIWYNSSNYRGFNAGAFVSSIGAGLSSAISSSSTPPGSSSGSSGGGGGGGSSGGGGGGGGGGGW